MGIAMTLRIPRALERYPLGQGENDRWQASDRERGRAVAVSRVRFGPDRREARDAFVERARALFTVSAPALVSVLDAGEWDDDAFIVEEALIEPRPAREALADLDPREKALAARALAEGIAALHEAGWSLASLDEGDFLIDAYRQPHLAIVDRAIEASEAARRADVDRLATIVSSWTPVEPRASAAELARAIEIPAERSSPLLANAKPPSNARWMWGALVLALALVVLYLAAR